MFNPWTFVDGHKRTIAASLAACAAAGQAVGGIWHIAAAWYPLALQTVEYLAGAVGTVGVGHAMYKSAQADAPGPDSL